MGPGRLRQFPRRAARHRHLPSGESRISRPDRVDPQGEGEGQDGHLCLSRHAGRHRPPHHHGQRPGRAGLGRRRHRGGSRHAGPADLHADPGSDRLQARRARCPRAPRPPISCSPSPRCCARRAWSASSWSSTGRASRISRSRTWRRSPTWRRNMAPPAASSRSMPRPSPISRARRAPSQQVALVEKYAKAPGHVLDAQGSGSGLHRHADARSRQRRSLHRRAEAPAGPCCAGRGRHRFRQGHGRRVQEGRRTGPRGSRWRVPISTWAMATW